MNNYKNIIALTFGVLLLLQATTASARTVIGEYWGKSTSGVECYDLNCGVALSCTGLTSGLVNNPSKYRNIVCPSNNPVKEIDRVERYISSGPEPEPFTFYKAYLEIEYEFLSGSEWITTTSGPFQKTGREVIECDCNENYIDRGARGQFCIDMTEGRYQDRVDGVLQSEIYNYLPNNHGERCPPIDTGSASEDDGGGHCVGNPCNPATGNKYQSEIDISGDFSFMRSYNSRNLFDHGLGKGWRNSYQKRLAVGSNTSLTIVSNTGKGEEKWSRATGTWRSDADSDVSLVETDDGFSVTRQNGDVEYYHKFGRLLSESDAQGKTSVYNYDANNRLVSVTNNYGQSLTLSYNSDDHLATVTDTLGSVTAYEYDANENLISVIYPDTTPTDDSDNPRRTYHYENIQYPNHLTGITDENGSRYATFSYDTDGKAISTEHAQTTNSTGQERFRLNYQGSN